MLELMQKITSETAPPIVDARTVAVRRSEAKAQRGPSTTRSTEVDEPLIDHDLPDDWYKCKACQSDVDPEDVKDRFLTDSGLCTADCAAVYITTLEENLDIQQRINDARKTALREIIDATDPRKVGCLQLTWQAMLQHANGLRQRAVKGLYEIKDGAA